MKRMIDVIREVAEIIAYSFIIVLIFGLVKLVVFEIPYDMLKKRNLLKAHLEHERINIEVQNRIESEKIINAKEVAGALNLHYYRNTRRKEKGI